MYAINTYLGRYLVFRMLAGIGIALAAVSASILLVDVVEQMRTVGARSEISLWQALGLTALRTPMLVEQTLPFVTLVGAMIGIVTLNRRSELVAMRAAGVSAWRFLGPSMITAALIGVAATTALNPFAAHMFERYQDAKAQITGQPPPGPTTRNGVWLRQGDELGQTVVHAAAFDPASATLSTATFFMFETVSSGDLRFVRRFDAEKAELRAGFWQLKNVTETSPTVPREWSAALAIPTDLQASSLLERFASASGQSFWRLPGLIESAREAGLAPVRYELKFQSLLAAPVLLAAMAALGSVFAVQLQRLGGLAQQVLTGLGGGFLLFFAGQIAAAFAITEVVPAPVAAWSPPLTGLFATLSLLSFREDG